MKETAKYEQVHTDYATSFLFYRSRVPFRQEMPLHFHPELEITYITKGSGCRIVGDYHEPFAVGEVIFVPSGIPHCWIYSPESCLPDGQKDSLFVQFSSDMLLRGIGYFKEMKAAVHRLLTIQQGVRIGGGTAEAVRSLLMGMQAQDASSRLFALMQMVQLIGQSNALYPIGMSSHVCYGITTNMERTQTIFKYIMEHYREKVDLPTIAALVHMSDTAFCRYFKRETGKTFISYINDYRIDVACSLLREHPQRDVSEVAWQCGFTDIPYFNRLFKRLKGVNPKEWRRG